MLRVLVEGIRKSVKQFAGAWGRIHVGLVLGIVAASFASTGFSEPMPFLDAAPAALFSPLTAQAQADAAFVRDRQVVRSRQVAIDLNLLTSSADIPPGVAAVGRVISLNLFADANFVAEAYLVERTSRGVTWVGRLRDIELSQVVITINLYSSVRKQA